MERCECCKYKKITVTCMSCKGIFCAKCIQIEIHNCKAKNLKIEKELERIVLKNQKIVSSKL